MQTPVAPSAMTDFYELNSPNQESSSDPVSSSIFNLQPQEPVSPNRRRNFSGSLNLHRRPRWPFLSAHSSISSAPLQRSSTVSDRPASRSIVQDAMEVPSSAGQANLLNTSQSTPSNQPQFTSAEKDIDDLEEAYETRRRAIHRQNTSTTTRVNRLFAPVPSAATSREPSFQKPSPATTTYERCTYTA